MLNSTASTSSSATVIQTSPSCCGFGKREITFALLFSAEHHHWRHVQEAGEQPYQRPGYPVLQWALLQQETVFHCHGRRHQICASTLRPHDVQLRWKHVHRSWGWARSRAAEVSSKKYSGGKLFKCSTLGSAVAKLQPALSSGWGFASDRENLMELCDCTDLVST